METMMYTETMKALAVASSTPAGMEVLTDYIEEHGHTIAALAGSFAEVAYQRSNGFYERPNVARFARPALFVLSRGYGQTRVYAALRGWLA